MMFSLQADKFRTAGFKSFFEFTFPKRLCRKRPYIKDIGKGMEDSLVRGLKERRLTFGVWCNEKPRQCSQ